MTDTTSMRISKRTLSKFNQRKAEEAGERGEGHIGQDEFLRFLLELYRQARTKPESTADWILTRARNNAGDDPK